MASVGKIRVAGEPVQAWQNIRMSLEIADTAYVLDHGVVVHHGPAAELAADEALIQSLAGASAEEWDLDKA